MTYLLAGLCVILSGTTLYHWQEARKAQRQTFWYCAHFTEIAPIIPGGNRFLREVTERGISCKWDIRKMNPKERKA